MKETIFPAGLHKGLTGVKHTDDEDGQKKAEKTDEARKEVP